MDKEKALRLSQAITFDSDVMVILQALASRHLRRSGVNFFDIEGNLGSSGKNLEKFLNEFDRTVFPHDKVALKSNSVIPKCNIQYVPIYSTDIALCYPGKSKNGKGDRKPSTEEVRTCIEQGFLLREIGFVKPKLILLLGKACRDNFFKFVIHEDYFPKSLTVHIANIIRNNKIPQYHIKKVDCSFHVLPIMHPSGANPHFYNLRKNNNLIKLIK